MVYSHSLGVGECVLPRLLKGPGPTEGAGRAAQVSVTAVLAGTGQNWSATCGSPAKTGSSRSRERVCLAAGRPGTYPRRGPSVHLIDDSFTPYPKSLGNPIESITYEQSCVYHLICSEHMCSFYKYRCF